MMNKICLLGRLTADPELKHTNSGTAVASFTLAVDRDFSGKDKEKKTDFINCVAWKNTAEFLSRYSSKGRMIGVSGSLQSRQYTDKDGHKRTAFEVNVENIYFADHRKESQTGETGELQEVRYDDGDLPF